MKTIPITPINDTASSCAESSLIALQILDTSMSPEFKPGHVVVIDNGAKLSNGAFVLLEHQERWFIRQWRNIDDEQITLSALDANIDDITVNASDVRIHGVVVQRSGRRRRDRVHYR